MKQWGKVEHQHCNRCVALKQADCQSSNGMELQFESILSVSAQFYSAVARQKWNHKAIRAVDVVLPRYLHGPMCIFMEKEKEQTEEQ